MDIFQKEKDRKIKSMHPIFQFLTIIFYFDLISALPRKIEFRSLASLPSDSELPEKEEELFPPNALTLKEDLTAEEIKTLLEDDGCALVVDLSGFLEIDDPNAIEASKYTILNLEPPKNEGGPLLSIEQFPAPHYECVFRIDWKDKRLDCYMKIFPNFLFYFLHYFFRLYCPLPPKTHKLIRKPEFSSQIDSLKHLFLMIWALQAYAAREGTKNN